MYNKNIKKKKDYKINFKDFELLVKNVIIINTDGAECLLTLLGWYH